MFNDADDAHVDNAPAIATTAGILTTDDAPDAAAIATTAGILTAADAVDAPAIATPAGILATDDAVVMADSIRHPRRPREGTVRIGLTDVLL